MNVLVCRNKTWLKKRERLPGYASGQRYIMIYIHSAYQLDYYPGRLIIYKIILCGQIIAPFFCGRLYFLLDKSFGRLLKAINLFDWIVKTVVLNTTNVKRSILYIILRRPLLFFSVYYNFWHSPYQCFSAQFLQHPVFTVQHSYLQVDVGSYTD